MREHSFRDAFVSLDGINTKEMFETRAQVLRTVPFFMRGVLRGAFRLAIDEVVAGRESGDRNREERGWKLFFLVPMMPLRRTRRGRLIPWKKWQDRADKFSTGSWVQLARDGWETAQAAKAAMVRSNRRGHGDADHRDARAEILAIVGLSAARQALENAELAPRTLSTLRQNDAHHVIGKLTRQIC